MFAPVHVPVLLPVGTVVRVGVVGMEGVVLDVMVGESVPVPVPVGVAVGVLDSEAVMLADLDRLGVAEVVVEGVADGVSEREALRVVVGVGVKEGVPESEGVLLGEQEATLALAPVAQAAGQPHGVAALAPAGQ